MKLNTTLHRLTLELSEQDYAEISRQANLEGYKNACEYLLALHKARRALSTPRRRERAIFQEPREEIRPFYTTGLGAIYHGDSAQLMRYLFGPASVDLIVTSPPFGLVRQKEYGNRDAEEYVDWFRQFAEEFTRILKADGSLVIDIGAAWKKGLPVKSLYQYELLLMLVKEYGFYLAQEFYWWNPARLPTPAEWVTIRRVRLKDAVNVVWWLSRTPYPRASNRRVLQPYSPSMEELFKRGYKPKLRPSGHDISDKFNRNNGGAIPPNLIAVANTESNSPYHRYCKENNLREHPAKFPVALPAFFIRMLTNKGDLVVDPFAGSCATGEAAERMERRWICIELKREYLDGAVGRFSDALQRGKDPIVRRREPYVIYPPHLSLLDETEAPLVEDGGRERS